MGNTGTKRTSATEFWLCTAQVNNWWTTLSEWVCVTLNLQRFKVRLLLTFPMPKSGSSNALLLCACTGPFSGTAFSNHGMDWAQKSPSPSPLQWIGIFNQIRLFRAASNLNVFKDWISTASLGNLCQCPMTLIVKIFLPYILSKYTLFYLKPLVFIL